MVYKWGGGYSDQGLFGSKLLILSGYINYHISLLQRYGIFCIWIIAQASCAFPSLSFQPLFFQVSLFIIVSLFPSLSFFPRPFLFLPYSPRAIFPLWGVLMGHCVGEIAVWGPRTIFSFMGCANGHCVGEIAVWGAPKLFFLHGVC